MPQRWSEIHLAAFDTPTLKVPAVNIGSRQLGRVRADNVIDVDFDKAAIAETIRFVLTDPGYRERLAACRNPYGDGKAAMRTVDTLKRLTLGPALVAKWRNSAGPFLVTADNAA